MNTKFIENAWAKNALWANFAQMPILGYVNNTVILENFTHEYYNVINNIYF